MNGDRHRVCLKCKQNKHESCFYLYKDNKLTSTCKVCKNEYDRTHQRTPDYLARRKIAKREPHNRWRNSKIRAQQKNLSWEITEQSYVNLTKQLCFYCDGPLEESGIGLDRKNSLKGYVPDNVVPCCKNCNQAKSNVWTFEEAIEIGNLFKKLRENRLKAQPLAVQ
jgi:hypothetical protein